MPANDLNKPLRRRQSGHVRRDMSVVARIVPPAAVLVALVSAVWIAIVDDPLGGQPVAVAMIQDNPAATGSVPNNTGRLEALPSSTEPDREPASALAAQADPNVEVAALPYAVPAVPGGGLSADPSLIEPSPFGPLPRIAADGRRPRDIYAGARLAGDPGAARIAIVIGGLGLSQTGTQRAIEQLPEAITLAFAPYGGSLQRWADKARHEGHEILLQIPLEPLGYPEENPGEHTLLVAADRRSNQADLNWSLGRMTSYAGVMNYMGARFSADEKALLPLMGEIGSRGLYYLDDGSSPRSRAAAVGSVLQVPVLTADLIIDRARGAGEIARQLDALERLARERGTAVGVASAFPASVEAIAAWAGAAAERGVQLVPATALLEP